MIKLRKQPSSPLIVCVLIAAAGLVSCGRPPLTGGRPYPPDFDGRGYPRAMVAWALNGVGPGTLQLIDVEHDTVNNQQDTVHSYIIAGYSAIDPLTIQDFPGQQVAYVFGDGGSSTGTASFQPVNTGTDRVSTAFPGIATGTTSAYITGDFKYVYSASPIVTRSAAGYVTVLRTTDGSQGVIPLPAANKLAPSPGAASGSASLLIFAANANSNSDNVYQLVGVGQNPIYQCTQQLLSTPVPFDHPINALYSSDGTSAFIFNCGPECGGTTASVSIMSTAAMAAAAAPAFQQALGCNVDPAYTPPPVTIPVQNVPVPGGVTDAVQLGTTLFVAGQALYPSGEFGGFLTAIDLTGKTAPASYVIGDGTHLRIRVGDGNGSNATNTLWIAAGGPEGSCSDGEQATLTNGITGCVTMVPIASSGTGYAVAGTCSSASPAPSFPGAMSCSSIVIEPSQGGAGGVAPIVGFNKTYSVEGGTVYIYSTIDGSAMYNGNVQVRGYAKDIAFIDGVANTAP